MLMNLNIIVYSRNKETKNWISDSSKQSQHEKSNLRERNDNVKSAYS